MMAAMRRLALLGLAGLLTGCVVAASTRLQHPETGDVRYCWQYAAFSQFGMIANTGRDEECIAKWQRQGYVERPNPVLPKETSD